MKMVERTALHPFHDDYGDDPLYGNRLRSRILSAFQPGDAEKEEWRDLSENGYDMAIFE